MPENTEFAVMYKKLLDRNFEPDPQRAAAALTKVLRSVLGNDPTSKPCEVSVEKHRGL